MKSIQTNYVGYNLICDDEDYDFLRRFSWSCIFDSKTVYVNTKIDGKSVKPEILLMKPTKGLSVDHKDHNGLNCQKDNLRIANASQQCMHRRKWGYAKYKGVNQVDNGYVARIQVNGERKYLGFFSTPELAAKAYNEAAAKYHGDFAVLNPVVEVVQ